LDPTEPAEPRFRVVPAAQRGEVLDLPVLLLNRHFVPIRVATVRRAMVLLYTGHGQALDGSGDLHSFETWSRLPPGPDDDAIRLVHGHLRAPRVVHLARYDRVPKLVVRLNRQNLMLRDQYQCQYCGKRPSPSELNLDHVIPRSRGGTDCWENLVVSCHPCNLKKGKRTPREAGMHLLRNPVAPHLPYAAMLLEGLVPPFTEWHPFLATG
jgi:5-methylcytosine-specific restriction endonuclease McrA